MVLFFIIAIIVLTKFDLVRRPMLGLAVMNVTVHAVFF
jgi:hypothetical protein